MTSFHLNLVHCDHAVNMSYNYARQQKMLPVWYNATRFSTIWLFILLRMMTMNEPESPPGISLYRLVIAILDINSANSRNGLCCAYYVMQAVY